MCVCIFWCDFCLIKCGIVVESVELNRLFFCFVRLLFCNVNWNSSNKKKKYSDSSHNNTSSSSRSRSRSCQSKCFRLYLSTTLAACFAFLCRSLHCLACTVVKSLAYLHIYTSACMCEYGFFFRCIFQFFGCCVSFISVRSIFIYEYIFFLIFSRSRYLLCLCQSFSHIHFCCLAHSHLRI